MPEIRGMGWKCSGTTKEGTLRSPHAVQSADPGHQVGARDRGAESVLFLFRAASVESSSRKNPETYSSPVAFKLTHSGE